MENLEGLDGLIEQAPEFLMTYGLKALAAIVIFIIGALVYAIFGPEPEEELQTDTTQEQALE